MCLNRLSYLYVIVAQGQKFSLEKILLQSDNVNLFFPVGQGSYE